MVKEQLFGALEIIISKDEDISGKKINEHTFKLQCDYHEDPAHFHYNCVKLESI